MRHAAIAVALLTLVLPAAAQTPQASFDVASIKANTSDSNRVNLDLQPGGRFVATNVSLMALVAVAYGDDGPPLPANRLVVKDNWISGTLGGYATAARFDIVAKAEDGLTREQLPAALRKLLADRFKLVVHHETRELPIYRLTLVRNDGHLGRKLRPSDVDCTDVNALTAKNDDGTSRCGFRRSPGRATGRATMPQLARGFLNSAVDDHRAVEDHTGLPGTFEFDIEWTPAAPIPADAPPSPPVDPNGPPLVTALREQLGLKLEPDKQRIDVLVVDAAERPTEN